MTPKVCIYTDEELARYHFGAAHPFGPARYGAFVEEFKRRGLEQHTSPQSSILASAEMIQRFHTESYHAQVLNQSRTGRGYLDCGDTPAFPGCYDAAAWIVGSTVDAAARIMRGEFRRGFIPIAGMHHAARNSAAGFCVFNDIGVLIEILKRDYGLNSIGYVDIDAHHGDGVFYAFEDDPVLIFADLHEDGRYLYPGTGRAEETGLGQAQGRKLNIPLKPGAQDQDFLHAWPQVEALLKTHAPEFIILQCGADSLADDPITHLSLSHHSHAYAAQRLCAIADELGHGRVLALGGGGYDLDNLANAWCAVVEALVEATPVASSSAA